MKIRRLRGNIYNDRHSIESKIVEFRQLLSNIKLEKEKPIIDKKLQRFELEFHKKFAMSFSCLVFIIFAFSVGLLTRSRGRFVGFGVGVVMSGIYWVLLAISFRLGTRLNFSPFLSMWLPNILVLSAGMVFLRVSTKQ